MLGCDMVYPARGASHFYGRGTPDPLGDDITLQSLEAKSARAMVLAAQAGTALVNLSRGPSRLIFPRAGLDGLARCRPAPFDTVAVDEALAREAALNYFVPSGRYWEEDARFSAAELRALDALWLRAAEPARRAAA